MAYNSRSRAPSMHMRRTSPSSFAGGYSTLLCLWANHTLNREGHLMQENFARSLQLVLVDEGGYVDHPRDPGGATNKGVTLDVFRSFYGSSKTKDDLRAIT